MNERKVCWCNAVEWKVKNWILLVLITSLSIQTILNVPHRLGHQHVSRPGQSIHWLLCSELMPPPRPENSSIYILNTFYLARSIGALHSFTTAQSTPNHILLRVPLFQIEHWLLHSLFPAKVKREYEMKSNYTSAKASSSGRADPVPEPLLQMIKQAHCAAGAFVYGFLFSMAMNIYLFYLLMSFIMIHVNIWCVKVHRTTCVIDHTFLQSTLWVSHRGRCQLCHEWTEEE